MDSLETTFLLVTIPLMIVAFCRLLGASGYGCYSMRLCCERFKDRKLRAIYVQMADHDQFASRRRIAKLSYQSVSFLTTAVAFAALAYVLTRIPLAIRNKACPDLNSCLDWGNRSYDGCEWAIDWLDDVIKELIGGGFECRHLSSPPD